MEREFQNVFKMATVVAKYATTKKITAPITQIADRPR
jgi:hypothetical protein